MAMGSLCEARFSVLIHGDSLPMDQIETALGLKATRIIRRGEVLNRLPLIEATMDEWVHSIPLTEPNGTDANLNALLSQLESKLAALRKLAETYQVTLRLYNQSDYAQIAYCLMPETLQRLVSLGMPLSVSSLSWGEVGI